MEVYIHCLFKSYSNLQPILFDYLVVAQAHTSLHHMRVYNRCDLTFHASVHPIKFSPRYKVYDPCDRCWAYDSCESKFPILMSLRPIRFYDQYDCTTQVILRRKRFYDPNDFTTQMISRPTFLNAPCEFTNYCEMFRTPSSTSL